MSYLRPDIARMAGYVPGFQPKDGVYVKLNTNENPYPPSPRAVAAMRDACTDAVRKYPDPTAEPIRRTIARLFGTAAECVLCGNGSDDLLNIAVRTFCGAGDAVAFPRPSYSLYDVLPRLQGAEPVPVDFPDDYSLPHALAASGARLVLICNPNAPSGTFIPPAELERLADSFDGVLLIDEAYVDFAEANCLELAQRRPNVVIARTLSKSYSLAGLRFGFAIAPATLIEGMMKVKDSYNVDALCAAGAKAALEDQEWMQANVARIKETRRRLSAELQGMGFHCWPSQANFILARVPEGRNARDLHERLYERKVLVRYFDLPRVDDCLRITVGTEDDTTALMNALRDVLDQASRA
jgi:histidinol-phosphate aminotransferase